ASPPTISHELDSVARALAFRWKGPKGPTLLTGETDGKVCFWGMNKKPFSPARDPVRVGGPLIGLEVSRDGRALLTHRAGDRACRHDPDPPEVRYRIAPENRDRDRPRVTLSPTGTELAVLAPGARVQLWDTRTWQTRTPAHQSLWPVRSLAFSPDGASLVTG